MENKKKPQIQVMLDLETMGVEESAVILEIALYPFDLDGTPTDIEPFHQAIDTTSCLLEGMKVEDSTQQWWMDQNAKAKWRLRHAEKTDIRKAIKEAHGWLSALCESYEVHLWCRGLNFDIPKFERCVRTLLEEELPYNWWNLEDARVYAHTFDVHNSDIEFQGIPHSAVDDCRHQIRIVQESWRRKELIKKYAIKGIVSESKGDRGEINRLVQSAFGTVLTDEQLDQLLS